MILATILCCVSFFVFILQLFKLQQGERFVFTAVIQLLACECADRHAVKFPLDLESRKTDAVQIKTVVETPTFLEKNPKRIPTLKCRDTVLTLYPGVFFFRYTDMKVYRKSGMERLFFSINASSLQMKVQHCAWTREETECF